MVSEIKEDTVPEEKPDNLLQAILNEREISNILWKQSGTGAPKLTQPTEKRISLMADRIISDAEKIKELECRGPDMELLEELDNVRKGLQFWKQEASSYGEYIAAKGLHKDYVEHGSVVTEENKSDRLTAAQWKHKKQIEALQKELKMRDKEIADLECEMALREAYIKNTGDISDFIEFLKDEPDAEEGIPY